MVIHAFKYTTQEEETEVYECFDCGDKLSSKNDLMSHKKAKHFKTKLCSYFHGNSTTCRFPAQKCMNIHHENILPTDAGNDYRSRILCKNGTTCFFLSQPGGCLYKHVISVEQQQNVWQQQRSTRVDTTTPPSVAQPVGRAQQPAAQSENINTLTMNQLVVNLSKQMEAISQKLQFLELKSMKDFPNLVAGQRQI